MKILSIVALIGNLISIVMFTYGQSYERLPGLFSCSIWIIIYLIERDNHLKFRENVKKTAQEMRDIIK